ncbi:MAG: GDP-mannose 4,6-dehydratase [Rhodospirillales bacterium]|nr:GDP-mannose 4,6-dehydratase [Rhodospirillales bacterium]
MKVAIGYHVQDGAWGGGNRFAKSLAAGLEARGDRVVYDLRDDDIDVLVLTDPRSRSPNISFAAAACLRYLRRRPEAVVIHRIDKPAGTLRSIALGTLNMLETMRIVGGSIRFCNACCSDCFGNIGGVAAEHESVQPA